MKHLIWLLWLFIPRGDGDGTGNDAGDNVPGDGGSNDDSGGGGPPGGSDPDGRPDWIAEKFWNADLKEPRTEILGKAYNELEGKLREKDDVVRESIRAEMIASAPDEYKVNLSKDLKIPDNVNLDLNAEDPYVKWFFGFAKENGMSQETVDKAINDYVGIELGNMPDVAKEIEKLGDHGQDRLLRVYNWMEAKLSEDQFKAMNPMLSTAVEIEALEALMKVSGPADFASDGGGKGLTLAELRKMQNDPRAWQDKEPVWLQKIEDGYKRLYKE